MKPQNYFKFPLLLSAALLAALLTSCSPTAAQPGLKVVATTSIIADVAAQVSGEHIAIDTLLPIGTDPHGFDPTPQDIAKVAEADLILANGVGLEEFLTPLIESAEAGDKVIYLNEGADFIETGEEEDHEDEEENVHEGAYDPHTWTDPNHVFLWLDHIEAAFSQLDPEHENQYEENANAYRAELEELDSWIRQQVSQIPENERVIITDHTSFAYFARQYGFQQAGTLIPGYSTLAEPTAQELAALEDTIASLDVKAVFVGNTVNPSLAERVTEDTGIQLVFIYTGSLSKPGGEADSYLAYIRYNVSAIVQALQTDP